jgi:hypothetical protein
MHIQYTCTCTYIHKYIHLAIKVEANELRERLQGVVCAIHRLPERESRGKRIIPVTHSAQRTHSVAQSLTHSLTHSLSHSLTCAVISTEFPCTGTSSVYDSSISSWRGAVRSLTMKCLCCVCALYELIVLSRSLVQLSAPHKPMLTPPCIQIYICTALHHTLPHP